MVTSLKVQEPIRLKRHLYYLLGGPNSTLQ